MWIMVISFYKIVLHSDLLSKYFHEKYGKCTFIESTVLFMVVYMLLPATEVYNVEGIVNSRNNSRTVRITTGNSINFFRALLSLELLFNPKWRSSFFNVRLYIRESWTWFARKICELLIIRGSSMTLRQPKRLRLVVASSFVARPFPPGGHSIVIESFPPNLMFFCWKIFYL